MKKKILSAILAATLVITSVTPTFATPNEEVIQNQKKYDEFTQKIEEINDKIFQIIFVYSFPNNYTTAKETFQEY